MHCFDTLIGDLIVLMLKTKTDYFEIACEFILRTSKRQFDETPINCYIVRANYEPFVGFGDIKSIFVPFDWFRGRCFT